jgi:hypothetical protein
MSEDGSDVTDYQIMTQMIENLIGVQIHQLLVMMMVMTTIRTNMIVRKSIMMTMQKRS